MLWKLGEGTRLQKGAAANELGGGSVILGAQTPVCVSVGRHHMVVCQPTPTNHLSSAGPLSLQIFCSLCPQPLAAAWAPFGIL
jgi:hypothetical protein